MDLAHYFELLQERFDIPPYLLLFDRLIPHIPFFAWLISNTMIINQTKKKTTTQETNFSSNEAE